MAEPYIQFESLETTLLREAAEAGHPEAMLLLGQAYAAGRGVARNPALARRWLLMAGEHGDAAIWAAIGKVFFGGDLEDAVEARYWLRLAADHGDAEAPAYLAYYAFPFWGQGGDLKEAMHWLLMAAARGQQQSVFELKLAKAPER
jgi:hypothetical protein